MELWRWMLGAGRTEDELVRRMAEVLQGFVGGEVAHAEESARMMRGSKGAARALDRAGRELETWRAGAGSAV